MLSFREVRKINSERKKENASFYDPITGEGSFSIPRVKCHIEGFPIETLFLPKDFAETPLVKELRKHGFEGFLIQVCKINPTEELRTELFLQFCKERFKYDFEFWAITCCSISAKGKGGDIKFRLNRAQRKLLQSLETLRLDNKPISIILLKARQWGGSTLTQIYMLWIQLIHKRNWNSVICGQLENQSKIVSGMLQKVIDHYPIAFSGEKIKTSPYQRSQSTRFINVSNSRYSVGSAEKPDKLRSEDISMVHFTEVGLWKPTKSKTPEDIVQSISGSLNETAYSVKVIESTAKGVGNFFHRTWLDAVEGENDFTPVFIPWFIIEGDSIPFVGNEMEEFYKSMDEYEWELFTLGATLEAIHWYRRKSNSAGFKGNHWRMCSEFPSTAREAFQSTGRRVFKRQYVSNMEATCIPPVFYGDFIGEEESGIKSLKNIRFEQFKEPQKENCLWVWCKPDLSELYRDRYIVMVDTGAGLTDKADYTCIKVIDRLPMLEGGVPEIVAEWHGRIEPDKIAWKAAQIAQAYGHALLVVESNKMEADKTEGENFEFILNELGDAYDNLYSRTSEEQIKKGMPKKWGFHTNVSTKPMVIKFFNKAIRDCLYIERDIETCHECNVYELKEDNKTMGAVEGNHDDRVMATAILVWVAYNWPLPYPIQNSIRKRVKIISEASI